MKRSTISQEVVAAMTEYAGPISTKDIALLISRKPKHVGQCLANLSGRGHTIKREKTPGV